MQQTMQRSIQRTTLRGVVAVGVAMVGLALSQAAGATVIYRWVDEGGRTHFSDVVPEKYRRSATRMDASEADVSAARARQATELAARQKALADDAAKRRQLLQPAIPASVASAPSVPKRPAEGITDATDCSTWRRLFQESGDCFGPYRTVGGGIKPEAFDRCNVIPSPAPKCGPVSE